MRAYLLPEEQLAVLSPERKRYEDLPCDRHAKVEFAVVFDPAVLGGLEELARKTALLMPFYVFKRSARANPGPRQARDWGMHRFVPSAREDQQPGWSAMYQSLVRAGLVAPADRGKRRHPVYEILLAPVMVSGALVPTAIPRTVVRLSERDIHSAAVPHSVLRSIRKLDSFLIRLLFAIYALSDDVAWKGADPNHLVIDEGRLVASDDLCRALEVEAAELCDGIFSLHRHGLLDFWPTLVTHVDLYPSARHHLSVVGDDTAASAATFRVRTVHHWVSQ